jgi:hypothetical protein
MGEVTIADLEAEARREGAKNPTAAAKVALGEAGGTARDRVLAMRAAVPEMFLSGSEFIRRGAGRSTRTPTPSSSTSGGGALNEAIRRGFGHAPAPVEPPGEESRVPTGDAEGGARGGDPRGSRLNVAGTMNKAIRQARGRSAEVELEFD